MRPKLHKVYGALALASVLLFSACSKQDSGTAPSPDSKADGKISYELGAINPVTTISGDAAGVERLAAITNTPPSLAKTTGFDFTWTEVKVRVREVKFSAKKNDSTLVDFSAKGDRVIDVLKAINSIGTIDIPKGTFQYVKVYVKVAGEEPKPAAILKGKITFQGKIIPFSIRLAGTVSLKADATDVVITNNSLAFKGKLQLDLKEVAAKLQLGDFNGSFSGGELVINVNVDATPGNKVKVGLESSLSAAHSRN